MTRRSLVWLLLGLGFLMAAAIAAYELIASPFQAMLLADYARRLTFTTAAGPSDSVRFPVAGPYDIRFGYAALPEYGKRLQERGFVITGQARVSPEMAQLADWGLFMPYREKTVAGLALLDCVGTPYFAFRQPRNAYADFTAVPPVVANTLLFIENRELLDPNHPRRNPAVEWDRLAQAMLEKLVQVVQPGRNVPGGSTLATQIEKYRHSPGGLTMTPADKLRQMASASVRAYMDGTDTRVTRRRIVLDYLNTVPLAAAPAYGEVLGLGEGLEAWFGLDFAQVNRLLAQPRLTADSARAYKHVLALLISQRKPSWYLVAGRKELDAQANVHLGLLAQAGIISPDFRDLARKQRIVFRSGKAGNGKAGVRDKAAASSRNELAAMLGVDRLYDLDRLDLTVTTSLHAPSQQAVADFLGRLDQAETVRSAGLLGEHLLSPSNDLSKVLYSFTLYELTEDGAVLRVQADSLDQPFDLNQGAKLDMGSSAKLRTLLTYLQIVAELHRQYQALKGPALARIAVPEKDALTRWALNYLAGTDDRDLETMLRAAMGRLYSADTGEAFFTGGGVHRFANFKREDDGRVMDLWEATRNSVNLPFIRLMRDIVRHFMYRAPGSAARVLNDVEDPRRHSYLAKFANHEGKIFLARFYKKYKGRDPEEATDVLLNHLTAHPRRLAAVYRYLEPSADLAAFTKFMKSRLLNPAAFSEADYRAAYQDYGPDRYSLADRAYIAQLHPLELWLVAHMRKHPGDGWEKMVAASAQARLDGYDWLFKTGRKNAQDIRIQSLLEIEAFQEIHSRWRRLGYPFSSMVPSYASAIGSSADRPAALAELIGIILNDGVKLDPASINQLEFGADTPYHTIFRRQKPEGERIFPAEIAKVVQDALVNVVRQGTARRVEGAFGTSLGKLVVGGKTGTGDHRYETYAPNGTVLESKVMNRVATFAFFVGRRFYGVVTAFVPGEAAGNYKFTSGLPVQILKALAPALQPLVAGGESRERGWAEEVAAFEAANPLPVKAKPAAPAVPAPTPPEAGQADAGDAPSADPAKIDAKAEVKADEPLPAAERKTGPAEPPAEAVFAPAGAVPNGHAGPAEAGSAKPAKPSTAKDAKPQEGKPQPAGPPPVKPREPKPQAAKPEAAKPQAAKPEAAKPEAAKPEDAKPEAAKPEAAKPQAAKPQAAKPEDAKTPDGKGPEEKPRQDPYPPGTGFTFF